MHTKSAGCVRMFRRPDFEGPSIGSMGLSVLKSHFIRTMNALFMLNMFLGCNCLGEALSASVSIAVE